MSRPRKSPPSELSTLVMGSPAWIKAVYEMDPARSVLGRSRPTQRNVSVDRELGTSTAVEGRLENMSLQLLEWLRNQGLVKRFKTQPFKLSRDDHGVDATPDFVFEDGTKNQYVLEVKPVDSLVSSEQAQQDEVARIVSLARMEFVLWTDQWPLTRTVYHNMWHMRRATKLGFSDDAVSAVVEAVASGSKALEELHARGLTFDAIHAAAYRGLVFLNVFHPINTKTHVHPIAPDYLQQHLFEGWRRADLAWSCLPNP
jgi:hypothetical protein